MQDVFTRRVHPVALICGAALLLAALPGRSQVVWTKLSPPHRPVPRSGHGMVYDASRDSFLLFGGSRLEDRLSDTWEFRNGDWIEIPAGEDDPPAVTALGMVYDASRDRAVLFGGQLGIFDATGELQTEFNGDVYEFARGGWERIDVPGSRPVARAAHAMAYDSRRGRVWLFGGRKKIDTETMELLNDTWYYDGSIPAWVEVESASRPSPRESSSLVYDPSRDLLYLYGGGFFRYDRTDETWELDPGTGQWSRVPVDAMPSARQNAAMAWVGEGKSVLFGGSRDRVGVDGETWIFDGETWVRAGTTGNPAAAAGAILAASAVPEEGLLFGGGYPERAYNDTWRLGFQPTPTPTGTPIPTPTVTPTATATPAGLPFDLSGDGVLDGRDIFLLAATWHREVAAKDQADIGIGDMDDSGTVDSADLLLLIDAWVTDAYRSD